MSYTPLFTVNVYCFSILVGLEAEILHNHFIHPKYKLSYALLSVYKPYIFIRNELEYKCQNYYLFSVSDVNGTWYDAER